MIVILHGDNINKSREAIKQIKAKLDTKTSDKNLAVIKKEFTISDISAQELKEEISSFSLFSDPPLIVLDITNAGRKNLADYIEMLKTIPNEANVIIFASKELSKTNIFLKNAKALQAKEFKNNITPTSNVFNFVDALFNKNEKLVFKELRNLILDGEDNFYIYSMVLYGLRNISYFVFDAPEKDKLHPFVKNKTKKQAERYTPEQIARLFREMYITDKNIKTGKLSTDHFIPVVIEKVLT